MGDIDFKVISVAGNSNKFQKHTWATGTGHASFFVNDH